MESININNDDFGKKIKDSLNENGFETGNLKNLNNMVDRYKNHSIQDFINENLPKMLELSPEFLNINDINFNDVDKKIEDKYKNNTKLIEKYGTSNDAIYAMKHKFKVYFDHLIFFMEENPDNREFKETIDKVKKILDGTYCE